MQGKYRCIISASTVKYWCITWHTRSSWKLVVMIFMLGRPCWPLGLEDHADHYAWKTMLIVMLGRPCWPLCLEDNADRYHAWKTMLIVMLGRQCWSSCIENNADRHAWKTMLTDKKCAIKQKVSWSKRSRKAALTGTGSGWEVQPYQHSHEDD